MYDANEYRRPATASYANYSAFSQGLKVFSAKPREDQLCTIPFRIYHSTIIGWAQRNSRGRGRGTWVNQCKSVQDFARIASDRGGQMQRRSKAAHAPAHCKQPPAKPPDRSPTYGNRSRL